MTATTSDRGSGPTAERLRHARDRSLVHLLHALVGLVGLHRRLRQLIGALVRHPTNLVGLLCTGSTVKVGSHRPARRLDRVLVGLCAAEKLLARCLQILAGTPVP